MEQLPYQSVIIISLVIIVIGRSVRIHQFRNFDESKIEAIGKYEKMSRIKYLISLIFGKKKDQ